MAALTFELTIEPPETTSNFKDFNRECEELDSEFLMQPVNEADYDSETQACVDQRDGGPTSFYDHYVTRRVKKRGYRGSIEGPAPRRATKAERKKEREDAAAKQQKQHQAHIVVDRLELPAGGSTALPKGSLSNVAVRRIACGRMPPPSFNYHTGQHDAPPGGVPTSPDARTAEAADGRQRFSGRTSTPSTPTCSDAPAVASSPVESD